MTAGNGSGVRCGSEGRAEVNITGRKLEAMLSSGFRHRWKNGNGSRLFRYFLPVCVCVFLSIPVVSGAVSLFFPCGSGTGNEKSGSVRN